MGGVAAGCIHANESTILEILDSTFTNNYGGQAGALNLWNSSLIVNGTTFLNNTSKGEGAPLTPGPYNRKSCKFSVRLQVPKDLLLLDNIISKGPPTAKNGSEGKTHQNSRAESSSDSNWADGELEWGCLPMLKQARSFRFRFMGFSQEA